MMNALYSIFADVLGFYSALFVGQCILYIVLLTWILRYLNKIIKLIK